MRTLQWFKEPLSVSSATEIQNTSVGQPLDSNAIQQLNFLEKEQ